jgi:hypothetical protein
MDKNSLSFDPIFHRSLTLSNHQYSMRHIQVKTGLIPRLAAETEEDIVCRRIPPTPY